MNPRVGDALRYLFPDANPQNDWAVANHGNGPIIEYWGLNSPQPTEDEIDAAVKAMATKPRDTKRQLEKLTGLTIAEIKDALK